MKKELEAILAAYNQTKNAIQRDAVGTREEIKKAEATAAALLDEYVAAVPAGADRFEAMKARATARKEEAYINAEIRAEELKKELEVMELALDIIEEQKTRAAAAAVREDIKENPAFYEKTPVHYKKFKARLQDITGENFYICPAEYTYALYLYSRSAGYNNNHYFLVDTTSEGKINFDATANKQHSEPIPAGEAVQRARAAIIAREECIRIINEAAAKLEAVKAPHASTSAYFKLSKYTINKAY